MRDSLLFLVHTKKPLQPGRIAELYSRIESERRRRHVEHVIKDHLAAEAAGMGHKPGLGPDGIGPGVQ